MVTNNRAVAGLLLEWPFLYRVNDVEIHFLISRARSRILLFQKIKPASARGEIPFYLLKRRSIHAQTNQNQRDLLRK